MSLKSIDQELPGRKIKETDFLKLRLMLPFHFRKNIKIKSLFEISVNF